MPSKHDVNIQLSSHCILTDSKSSLKNSVKVDNVHKKSAVDYTVKGCSPV